MDGFQLNRDGGKDRGATASEAPRARRPSESERSAVLIGAMARPRIMRVLRRRLAAALLPAYVRFASPESTELAIVAIFALIGLASAWSLALGLSELPPAPPLG